MANRLRTGKPFCFQCVRITRLDPVTRAPFEDGPGLGAAEGTYIVKGNISLGVAPDIETIDGESETADCGLICFKIEDEDVLAGFDLTWENCNSLDPNLKEILGLGQALQNTAGDVVGFEPFVQRTAGNCGVNTNPPAAYVSMEFFESARTCDGDVIINHVFPAVRWQVDDREVTRKGDDSPNIVLTGKAIANDNINTNPLVDFGPHNDWPFAIAAPDSTFIWEDLLGDPLPLPCDAPGATGDFSATPSQTFGV